MEYAWPCSQGFPMEFLEITSIESWSENDIPPTYSRWYPFGSDIQNEGQDFFESLISL